LDFLNQFGHHFPMTAAFSVDPRYSGLIRVFSLIVATNVFLSAASGEQKPDAATVKGWLDDFKRSNYALHEREIAAAGQLAVDGIMDYAETGHVHYASIYRKGAVPSQRLDPLRNLVPMLRVLPKVNAPFPVERLAVLIEKGMGPLNPEGAANTVLALLAQSGHDRALALIRHQRDLALKSSNPMDREWVNAMEEHLKTWETCRGFITTGTGARPSPACQAMRRKYLEDNTALTWNSTLSVAYLSAALSGYGPRLSEQPAFIHTTLGSVGRFYEPVLASAVAKWVEGDGSELARFFGDNFPVPGAAKDDAKQVALVAGLVSGMTGDEAFRAALRLLKNKACGAGILLNFPPERWLPQLIDTAGLNPETGVVGLMAYSTIDRPLTSAEKEDLHKLLAIPRLSFPWLGSDGYWTEHVSVIKLAKIAPDVFRDVAKEEYLSMPVVDAIMREKLFDDRKQIYRLIERGMRWDWVRTTPLPPEDEPPGNLKMAWLKLVAKHFADADGISFLVELGKKKGFESVFGEFLAFGPTAVPVIARQYDSSDARVRFLLVRSLRQIAPKDEALMAILIKALADKDATVRAEACAACLSAKPAGSMAVPALLKCIGDEDAAVRTEAARSMGSMANLVAADHLPVLLKHLEHKDPAVRRSAVHTLRPFCSEGAVRSGIIRAMGDTDPGVVEIVANNLHAYTEQGTPEEIHLLAEVLKNTTLSPYAKTEILNAIAKNSGKASDALLAVESLLQDSDAGVRRAAELTAKAIRTQAQK
jgi:HEAT repeat protein